MDGASFRSFLLLTKLLLEAKEAPSPLASSYEGTLQWSFNNSVNLGSITDHAPAKKHEGKVSFHISDSCQNIPDCLRTSTVIAADPKRRSFDLKKEGSRNTAKIFSPLPSQVTGSFTYSHSSSRSLSRSVLLPSTVSVFSSLTAVPLL